MLSIIRSPIAPSVGLTDAIDPGRSWLGALGGMPNRDPRGSPGLILFTAYSRRNPPARSASVEAIEATVCAVITRQALLQHIAEQPDFALELIAKVIRRARSATLTSKQLALNDVYGRLKQLLEAAAKPQPDGSLWIDRRLSHRELAQHVAWSREMVRRVMKDLVPGGYAAVDGAGLRLRSRLPPRW